MKQSLGSPFVKCTGCGQTKFSAQFPTVNGKRHGAKCKECTGGRLRKWYQENKEYVADQRKQYIAANRDKIREYIRQRAKQPRKKLQDRAFAIRSKYGLTLEQWDALFVSQGMRCAICGTVESDRWCTDHDHSTGEIRGILCSRCNRSIGLLGDDAASVRRALAYLERGTDRIEEHW